MDSLIFEHFVWLCSCRIEKLRLGTLEDYEKVCDQNDTDGPHPGNAHYREKQESFAGTLDNQDKINVQQF